MGLRTEPRASVVCSGTQRRSGRREFALLPQAVLRKITARERPVRHGEEMSKRLRQKVVVRS